MRTDQRELLKLLNPPALRPVLFVGSCELMRRESGEGRGERGARREGGFGLGRVLRVVGVGCAGLCACRRERKHLVKVRRSEPS